VGRDEAIDRGEVANGNEAINEDEVADMGEVTDTKMNTGMNAGMNTVQGFHFDTVCVISAPADEKILVDALALCPRYEQLLSRFAEGSDVWRLNHAAGAAVEVSADTLTVLRCAEEVRQLSGGAFNIAIGATSRLWGFGEDNPAIPDDTALDRAVAKLADFALSIEGTRVCIPADATIDLGGIAKGYICDRIADHLRATGVRSALLNFGGNVVTVGEHPNGRPWQIGLQLPEAPRDQGIFASVASRNNAVVTSGTYERHFEMGGKSYHHILDPRTGCPAETDLLSTTVIASDSMLADALATALLVLGNAAGIALAQHFDVAFALLDSQHRLTHSGDLDITYM
jgi:thiamine biosynthesis lipoprotein